MTYMVCVDGGLLDEDDETMSESEALARAKELKSSHPDWLVSIVLCS